MPAVVWLCGPPCRPGKTALSIAVACAASVMIIAPRGPRSVLCVVVVITGAKPTGDGCAPPAIRPAMCAMSATSTASTSAAICREGREVHGPGQRRAAAEDDLGPLAQRQVAHLVQVDPAGVAAHPVLHGVEPLAADRHARPVRQVAAHRQREPHDRVAGRGERQVDGQVRRATPSTAARSRAPRRTEPAPATPRSTRSGRSAADPRSTACPGNPRSTCWSAPCPRLRARPPIRSSPTGSAGTCRAGGEPRRGSAPRSPGLRRRSAGWAAGAWG